MTSRTLAEILEEGERAWSRRNAMAPFVTDEWQMWLLINGPRLLAVARAAEWVANDMRYRAPEQAAGLYRTVWLAHLDAAWDAAAGGGEEK